MDNTQQRESVSDQVSRELIRLLYTQLPRALLFSILVSTVFVAASWEQLPKQYLIPWYVALSTITVMRYFLVRYFIRRGLDVIPLRLLRITGSISAAVVGTTWAALALVILITDQTDFHVLVTLLLSGLAAGALSSNAYFLPSYIGFMAPILVSLTIVFFWQQTEVSSTVGVLLLFYMGYLIDSARLFHLNIARSIELAIENKQLSKALSESKIHLEQHVLELKRLSSADALTGVANRRRYEEVIRDAWATCRRSKKPISLVLLDIDHFKEYNDEYGHQMGDQCLVQVAQAMEDCVLRHGDLVARIGGEEFVVIMPDTDLSGASYMAEAIQQAVTDLNISHRASPVINHVTVSLGVATAVEIGESKFSSLVGAADHALYEAKASGRDLVVVSDAEIH